MGAVWEKKVNPPLLPTSPSLQPPRFGEGIGGPALRFLSPGTWRGPQGSGTQAVTGSLSALAIPGHPQRSLRQAKLSGQGTSQRRISRGCRGVVSSGRRVNMHECCVSVWICVGMRVIVCKHVSMRVCVCLC